MSVGPSLAPQCPVSRHGRCMIASDMQTSYYHLGTLLWRYTCIDSAPIDHGYHSGYGLGQWEEALHSNASSHWTSRYPEWFLNQALTFNHRYDRVPRSKHIQPGSLCTKCMKWWDFLSLTQRFYDFIKIRSLIWAQPCCHFRKHKYTGIFAFSIIYLHTDGVCSWNPSLKTRICLSCFVNSVVADVLAAQRTKASAAMVFTSLYRMFWLQHQ